MTATEVSTASDTPAAEDMTDKPLTDQERTFCRRYAMARGNDPIGAFLAAFEPEGGLSNPTLGGDTATLLERNEILLEIHALQRVMDETRTGRILLELEDARHKALSEEFGAETALSATIVKAQMLGYLPAQQVVQHIHPVASDELPGERELPTYH